MNLELEDFDSFALRYMTEEGSMKFSNMDFSGKVGRIFQECDKYFFLVLSCLTDRIRY